MVQFLDENKRLRVRKEEEFHLAASLSQVAHVNYKNKVQVK